MRGHIRRRGNKWAVIVDVGLDQNGQRKQRWHSGFDTKRDATRALTEILGRLQIGAYVEPNKQTIAAFLAEWLDSIGATVRPSTWESYAMNVRVHVVPYIGDVPLQSLSAAHLNSLYATLLRDGRRNGSAPLSRASVRHVHVVLRRALGEATRWDRIARNPAVMADPPRPGPAPQMKTWNAEELRAFLGHMETERLYPAWLLIATTGLRRGELLGLHWRDVDLDEDRVAVTQSLVATNDGLVFSPPKTRRGRRLVALDPRTASVLRNHRTAQIEHRLALGPVYEDNDLVFAHEDGTPLHPIYFSEQFRNHAKAAGLPRIRLHDLRHTHATLALQAGVHPKVVSERLGHSTIAITLDTYSHAIPAMQEEAAEKIAAVVFG